MHHCPNCETELLTKEEYEIKYKEKPKPVHQHANHLDLENCPECGFNFDTRELMRVEDKHKVKLHTTPPKGSKLDSFRYSNSILEILAPREGFSSKVRAPLAFGIFWLAFVAMWTLFASAGGILFAAFSIPFWFTGITMVYSITKTIFEEQKFELNGKTLNIQKNRLLNSKEEEIDLAYIQSIKLEPLTTKNRVSGMANARNLFNKKSKIPTITLKDGSKETLLENGTQAEKIWLVNLLNDYLKEVVGSEYMK